jgi:transcription antitermination factor NusG
MYEAPSAWQDRVKLLSIPLFPCYVFLKGELRRSLDILATPGIFSLVSSAGQPIAIPADEINAIQQTLKSGARVEPHQYLECGESVRVKAGALTGIQGILVRKKNIYRLVLSVQMLGKAVAVEVDSSQIERVGGKRPLTATTVHGRYAAYFA